MRAVGNFLLIAMMISLALVAGLQWALGYWVPFMTGMLVVAGICLVTALVLNAKDYLKLLQSDAFGFVAKGFGTFALVLCFLVALNYLAYQNNFVGDWTPNQVNSLSPISKKALQDLDEDFVFHIFHTNSTNGIQEKNQVEKALKIYERSSSKIRIEVHSIFKEPNLAKEYKVGEATAALFATFKGRRKRLQGLLEEKEVTGTILRLSRREKVIYFSQNHDERSLRSEGTYGLTRLKVELERLFYTVKPLESFPVPEDAAFLAIVGPRKNFSEDEIQSLKDFLKGGGHLLVAVDPGEAHGLSSFLKDFGVSFQDTFMASRKKQESQYSVFLESSKFQHELGQILEERLRPVWYLASPLKIIGHKDTTFRTLPVLKYENESISLQGLDENSSVLGEGGQIACVLSESIEGSGNEFSMIVAGDSDFLTNQFVQMSGNFTLTLGTFNYLSRDNDIMNLQPKKAKTNYLLLAQTKLNFYVLFFILPFPLFFFLIALFLKLRRAF